MVFRYRAEDDANKEKAFPENGVSEGSVTQNPCTDATIPERSA
jgi:hypothetical protein